jgi:Flp pilus assembly pilin Flp
MESIRRFLDDERGTTSLAIRLVLAVTVGAAVLIVLLQAMHANQATAKNASTEVGRGAKKGLADSMKRLTDQ